LPNHGAKKAQAAQQPPHPQAVPLPVGVLSRRALVTPNLAVLNEILHLLPMPKQLALRIALMAFIPITLATCRAIVH
jgi:hypothetical protein